MAGWFFVLATGSVVCAVIGYDVYFLTLVALVPRDLGDELSYRAFFGSLLVGPIIVWPIAFAASVIPLSLAYAVLRWLAKRNPFTTSRRVAAGLIFGFATNIGYFIWAGADVRIPGVVAALLFFPFKEIQASALVMALVVPRRWFGVA